MTTKYLQINRFLYNRKAILLALLVLLVYLSPYIFFPHEARYLIHDNLDSNVVWYKNLAESGKMFSSSNEIVPNSLGGIPRGCYPSELNFLHLLYLIVSPLYAYAINIVLMHFIAFFSMYVLLRKYIFKPEMHWASVFVSLIFSLLPFWPSGGAALSAQPLLLFAFLNILNNDLNVKNWLILLLIPFYSVLALTNFFFIIVLFLFFIGYCLYYKKVNFYFVAGLLLFTVASVISDYRLFYMQFIQHFESHRNVLSRNDSLNIRGVMGVSILHFLKGQYHFISFQTPFILFSSVLALIVAKSRKDRFVILSLLAFIFLISLIYVLPSWNPIGKIMAQNSLLSAFSLRFHSLFPLLWFITFAYAINIILLKNNFFYKRFVVIIFVASCFFLFFSINTKDYYKNNFAENSFFNTYINTSQEGFSTFDDYYQTKIFKKIKSALPIGNYYVACLGMDPEVVQYNGYFTIDGYFFYYAKFYNKIMRAISEKEMQKSNINELNSHCVIISDDLKKGKDIIDNLELNFELMKKIGTKYIFSRKKIVNSALINEQSFGEASNHIFIYQLR